MDASNNSEVYRCYVGGLAPQTTKNSLWKAFEKFGLITGTMVERDQTTGKVFGLVTYATSNGRKNAIGNMNGTTLDGSTITVSRVYECYVGGLAYKTDKESLLKAFSKFKDVIIDVKIPLDKNSNDKSKSKGFGFVLFSSEEGMRAAIKEMDGQNLDGRYIRVNQAGAAQSAGNGNGRKVNANKAQTGGDGGKGTGGYECYVRGLVMENWMEDNVELLNQAFSKFGEVVGVKVPIDEEKYCKGYGFVKFSTEESMRAAVEGMDGQELNGRRISVKQAGAKSSGGNNGVPRGGYRTFVGGFPETCDKETLEKTIDKVFNKFGQITIDVVDGRGFGFVTFDNEEARRTAIEQKNGKKIYYVDENGKKINCNVRINEAQARER